VKHFRFPALCAVAFLGLAATTAAQDERGETPSKEDQVAWKLTPTYYSSTGQAPAWDVNLRGNTETQTWWVGYYRRQEEFTQLRLGYERPVEWSFVKMVPSFQYATRGFLGGSVNAEIGETYFGVLGWGRTNLKDYYNLNFDPNDAVTFGVGTRALPKTVLTLFQIRDDRLDTGQRVTHLVARIRPDARTRWTFDAFHKQGRADSDPASPQVRSTGATITYDFGRYFVRVASDPYVNFSNDHMVRIAFGMRF
jgi:hypothetical protein